MVKVKESTWKFLIRRSNLANMIAAGLVCVGIAYFVVTTDTDNVKTLVLLGAGVLFKTLVDNKNGSEE